MRRSANYFFFRRSRAASAAGAFAHDATRYFDLHHTANDTLDKIDPAQLSQNVAAWAGLIWLIADSDVDFRAMRPADASPDAAH